MPQLMMVTSLLYIVAVVHPTRSERLDSATSSLSDNIADGSTAQREIRELLAAGDLDAESPFVDHDGVLRAPSALVEEDSGLSGKPPPQDEPEVVKEALRVAWRETQLKCKAGEQGTRFPAAAISEHKSVPFKVGSRQCKVDILPSVNYLPGRFCVVRKAWSRQFPNGFMSGSSADQEALGLIGQFKKLSRVTQGSKSGSSIYVSDTKQLFLKSETQSELDVFTKRSSDRNGHSFVEDYVARVIGNDDDFERTKARNLDEAIGDQTSCERSTLQRFLLVFTVACKGWWQWWDPTVWTLFGHISPLAQVPNSLHQFDLKASRDESDCHNRGKKGKEWKGELESNIQGYLGDFLALYKMPIASSECSEDRLTFRESDNRKVCLMRALHMDLRLLGKYNLVDYSFLVTLHQYKEAVDERSLEAYNNLLKVTVQGHELVLTIGLIDLLRDYDSDRGLQFQSKVGVNKDLSESKHIYGQPKFEAYSYYLFCLAVDVMDPPCSNTRRLLSPEKECPAEDESSIVHPDPGHWNSGDVQQLTRYMNKNSYCDLVASCQSLNHEPVTRSNLNICQDHACKVFGARTCPRTTTTSGRRKSTVFFSRVWKRLGFS